MTRDDDQLSITWMFARGLDTIRVSRAPGLNLLVHSESGEVRHFGFNEVDALIAFQCSFEQHLVETGWSLIELSRTPPPDAEESSPQEDDEAGAAQVS